MILRAKCETCQAVLKTRHLNLAGQIVACPKCGGMVALPAASEATGDPAHSTNKDAGRAPSTDRLEPAAAVQVASLVDSSIDGINPEQSPPGDAATHTGDSLAAGTQGTDAAPAGPGIVVANAGVSKRSTLLLSLLCLGLGIVAVLGAFWWQGKQPRSVGQAAAPNSPPQADAAEPSTPEPEVVPEPDAQAGPSGEASLPIPEPEAPSAEPVKEGSPSESSESQATPVEVPARSNPPEVAPATEPQPGQPTAEPQTAPSPPAASSGEPAAAEPPPVAAPANNSTAVAEDSSQPLPVVDVPARLLDPIAAVSCNQVPLGNFVQELQALTQIPITLDLESLSAAGVDAHTPVSLTLKETSSEAILTSVASQLGMKWEALPPGVVIHANGLSGCELPFPPASIASEDQWETFWSQVATRFPHAAGEAPPTVERTATGLRIAGPTRAVGAMFMAGKRMVEPLRPTSNRQTVKTGALELAVGNRVGLSGWGRTKHSHTLTIVAAEPAERLCGLVQQALMPSKESSVLLVVDWQSLAAAGMHPQVPLTFAAHVDSDADLVRALAVALHAVAVPVTSECVWLLPESRARQLQLLGWLPAGSAEAHDVVLLGEGVSFPGKQDPLVWYSPLVAAQMPAKEALPASTGSATAAP